MRNNEHNMRIVTQQVNGNPHGPKGGSAKMISLTFKAAPLGTFERMKRVTNQGDEVSKKPPL